MSIIGFNRTVLQKTFEGGLALLMDISGISKLVFLFIYLRFSMP